MEELQQLSHERFKYIQESFTARNAQHTNRAAEMKQTMQENQDAFKKIMAAIPEDANNVKGIWRAVLKSLR